MNGYQRGGAGDRNPETSAGRENQNMLECKTEFGPASGPGFFALRNIPWLCRVVKAAGTAVRDCSAGRLPQRSVGFSRNSFGTFAAGLPQISGLSLTSNLPDSKPNDSQPRSLKLEPLKPKHTSQ